MKRLLLLCMLCWGSYYSYAQQYISQYEYVEGVRTPRTVIITFTEDSVKLQWIHGVYSNYDGWALARHASKKKGEYYFLKYIPIHFAIEGKDIRIYSMDKNRLYHVDIQFSNIIQLK